MDKRSYTLGMICLASILFLIGVCCYNNSPAGQSTICNPMDLNYRFQINKNPSYREGADPTVIWFKDRYYLFASMSGGYWHSKDLAEWSFVRSDQIPTEDYAPTAIAIQDTIYFMASSEKRNTIYKSADPLSGKWQIAKDSFDFPVWDPAFFMDDDQRLYFYWGCHPAIPIRGVELDYRNNFEVIGKPEDLVRVNLKENGWEVFGEINEQVNTYTWIEGTWLNKYNGKYYLQYASPGTQFKSYNDAVYVADKPLGPYKRQDHNPFAYKPGGFMGGAGHGSTFIDKYGNYWHMGTMAISVKHNFERRMGLWPAFFDKDGTFNTYTGFGDFPHTLPQRKMSGPEDYQPQWMLLSYGKAIEVSSSLPDYPGRNAADEDARTYWSAESGKPGEWLMIDLSDNSSVYAIQVNFAEQNSHISGLADNIFYQYKIERSPDKKNWETLIDKSHSTKDSPHEFIRLPQKKTIRYIRITNIRVPDGNFAISGFRVFGFGNGKKPQPIRFFTVDRDQEDKRKVTLKWEKRTGATGYNIRYGIAPDKLYQNYQVMGADSLTIHSLNSTLDYYFTIDIFNENGISKGDKIVFSFNSLKQ
ncbi:MAG: family 43 glycosylhydrolase [Bacteroidales bacterium]|nr:family 43 glycosylhydrolase [Bacteroidales bacterium]